MTVSRVNQLNRSFTVIFTEAMQSIKPKTDIEKLRNETTDNQKKINESYGAQIKEWQTAFAFRLDLRPYINNLNNLLVLAGGSNSSEGRNSFTPDSLATLKNFMRSDDKGKSFEEYMNSCAPKSSISDYEEKLEIWNKEFDFPSKLNKFISELEVKVKDNNTISADDYIKQIDDFIKKLAVNEDEFLLEETDNVSGEEYVVNSDMVAVRAETETTDLENEIVKNIADTTKSTSKVAKKIKDNFSNEKETFNKVMKDAKKNQLEVKAEKKIIEKKYDNPQLKFEIDPELAKKGAQAIKKHFPQYMNVIAGASIGIILALAIASLLCIGCTSEIISAEGKTNVDDSKSFDISNVTSINAAISEESTVITTNTVIRNPATELLESELILILVSTFIAPVATRVIKEKFDIDVTEKQINMIMEDGIKSTTMFAKEADKLRDSNGHIPRKYQKTLRDKAFTSLRANYTTKKYKDVAASVGSEVFEKAIESAVSSGRLEKFPLEKKQVKALIEQSIDAVPGIVEWQKLDDQAKTIFIDGNIRKLLQNTGINGWSHKALENIFDAEVSKRLVNAALIEKDTILQSLDSADHPYLKYTSTAVDALLERK